MVMGDHPGTAKAIAQQVGMVLANLSTVAADVADVMVMTAGNGVNDSPLLKHVDVGIAIGQAGSMSPKMPLILF